MVDKLTPTEIIVVKLLSSGKTEKEAAVELSISPGTMSNHKLNIYRKLGFSSRVKLVHYAIDKGILEVMKF